ncbi:MAG: hypothetical protein KY464_03535 [Gemmatimonadetes bacterium]|nr:hypothetical protein [Gemmatimonadota bacterium]
MTQPLLSAASILRQRLAHDQGALLFAEAVFAQLISPAGALREGPAEVRDALAHEVADLLLASPDDPGDEGLALRLLEQPPLAAAFFQNLDLLYSYASPYANRVGTLLMHTLELAAAAEADPAEA